MKMEISSEFIPTYQFDHNNGYRVFILKDDHDFHYNKKLARIAELEAAMENCISLGLHNSRVDALEKQLSELRAENERLKKRGDGHWETLRSIREMYDIAQIHQWIKDAGSGYTETTEITMFKLQFERDKLKSLCETMASALESYIGQFEKLKEKQDRLLKNGFEEACDNWVEATSDDFDLMNLAPLMEALEKFKALKGW